jgi:hypothetical protein
MTVNRAIQGHAVQAMLAQDWEGAAKILKLAVREAMILSHQNARADPDNPIFPSISLDTRGNGMMCPSRPCLGIVRVEPRDPGSFGCLDLHPYAYAFVHSPAGFAKDGNLASDSLAIMIYNLALTYHLQGIHSRDPSSLMKAMKLYKLTWSTVTKHVDMSGKKPLQSHHLLTLAAVYNMGQICTMTGFTAGVTGCAAHIQCLLKHCCEPGIMDPNYSSEWSEQVRFFATSLLHISCWGAHSAAAAA